MSNPQTTIVVTHDKSAAADLKHKFQAEAFTPRKATQLIEEIMSGLAGGVRCGTMTMKIDDGDFTYASGTVTFSNAAVADDTILINGVTFTAKASGATGNQFNVGTTATHSATAFKAAVNASATALVNGHVTADNVAGVVTLTAVIPGVAGNAVTLAEGVDASGRISCSVARLEGGAASANSTTKTYSFGV